jgi:hypothetical protein
MLCSKNYKITTKSLIEMKANGENLYAYCHDYNGKIVDSD